MSMFSLREDTKSMFALLRDANMASGNAIRTTKIDSPNER